MKILMNRSQYVLSSFMCLVCLFLFGCRSTPEMKPHAYQVICDKRLAMVMKPLIPEAEKIFGPVQVEFLSVEDCQARILAGSADAWFTLENDLGLDYLLRMYKDVEDDELTVFFSPRVNPEVEPGKTILMYDVFQFGKYEYRLGEWVGALKEAGLDDRLAQQEIGYPVWEKWGGEELVFLDSIVIDELNFNRADLKQIISEVWEKGRAQTTDVPLPEVRVEVFHEIPPITLKLRNVTVLDSLKTVTEISGLYFKMDGNGVVICSVGVGDENRAFYALPPEKVTRYFDDFNEIHMRSYGSAIPGPIRSFPERPLTDIQKLQYCTLVYGDHEVTLTDFEAEYGIIGAKGFYADQPAFKSFLRQIYFYPATRSEVSWHKGMFERR